MVQCTDDADGRQHRRCITQQAVNTVCGPEDGRNYCPKHVELIGIINKPLLLRQVGCLYYCISGARSYKRQRPVYVFLFDFQQGQEILFSNASVLAVGPNQNPTY